MRLLLVLGGALLMALVATGQLVVYQEGLRFTKFFWWPLVFPLWVAAIGAVGTAATVTLYHVARRRVPLKWGIAAAAMPVIAFLPMWLPLGSFTDGLRQAVQTRLSAEQLFLLAEDVRQQPIERIFNSELYRSQVAALRARHEDVFALTPEMPRVSVDHGHVELVYGSGLIKHWGIAFSDSCPRDYLEEDSCQEAYRGIWVYDDIY